MEKNFGVIDGITSLKHVGISSTETRYTVDITLNDGNWLKLEVTEFEYNQIRASIGEEVNE